MLPFKQKLKVVQKHTHNNYFYKNITTWGNEVFGKFSETQELRFSDENRISPTRVAFFLRESHSEKNNKNFVKSRQTRIEIEKSNSRRHGRGLHFSEENYVQKNALKIQRIIGRRELQWRKVILVVVDRECVFLQ